MSARVARLRARLDREQQGRRWLAFPVAVLMKFGEDDSSNLAVVITYYAFFSIFPLLLALASVLGFVLSGHAHWQSRIENSALKNLPLVKGSPLPHSGNVIVVVVGAVLALYSGLAVAKAAHKAWDRIYQVDPDSEPNIVSKNLHALRLVLVGGLGLIVTTAVVGTVTSGSALHINVGWGLTVAGVVVSAVLNTGLLIVIFRWLTVRELTIRDVLPGAAFAAVVLALLQSIATAFISHKLQHTKETYGAFGTVIVLLSWFYLQAQVLLLAAQVNVVKQDRLWPRSLAEE
jgi:YihY family inner membrane protein